MRMQLPMPAATALGRPEPVVRKITTAEYDESLAAAYDAGRRDATVSTAPAPTGGTYATPRVLATARKLGVDLAKVKGTGIGGRITPKDVSAAAPAVRTPQPIAQDDSYPAWMNPAAHAPAKAAAQPPRVGKHAGTAYPANWAH